MIELIPMDYDAVIAAFGQEKGRQLILDAVIAFVKTRMQDGFTLLPLKQNCIAALRIELIRDLGQVYKVYTDSNFMYIVATTEGRVNLLQYLDEVETRLHLAWIECDTLKKAISSAG